MDPPLHRPREIQAGRMAQKVVDRKSSLEIESNMSQARFHDDKLNQDSILIPQSEQVFWASLKGIQYLGEILGSCTENALICFWFVVLYFWCFYLLTGSLPKAEFTFTWEAHVSNGDAKSKKR